MTCLASDTMTISEPDSITILGNVIDADCYGASTGSITTNINGGSFVTLSSSNGKSKINSVVSV